MRERIHDQLVTSSHQTNRCEQLQNQSLGPTRRNVQYLITKIINSAKFSILITNVYRRSIYSTVSNLRLLCVSAIQMALIARASLKTRLKPPLLFMTALTHKMVTCTSSSVVSRWLRDVEAPPARENVCFLRIFRDAEPFSLDCESLWGRVPACCGC